MRFKYEHKKTGNLDGLSIVRAGRCEYFELGADDAAYLGAHSEFLEE